MSKIRRKQGDQFCSSKGTLNPLLYDENKSTPTHPLDPHSMPGAKTDAWFLQIFRFRAGFWLSHQSFLLLLIFCKNPPKNIVFTILSINYPTEAYYFKVCSQNVLSLYKRERKQNLGKSGTQRIPLEQNVLAQQLRHSFCCFASLYSKCQWQQERAF